MPIAEAFFRHLDPDVRIELPGKLGQATSALKMMGMGKQVEQLETSMNLAAEAAVPQAQAILIDTVKQMSVQDAKSILSGPNDAATQYLNKTSADALTQKFLPIVKTSTKKLQLAEQYNAFAGKAASAGLIDQKDADIDRYVTQKAMDGLFLMIAEEEKAIRENPVGAAGNLAKKVFGALR